MLKLRWTPLIVFVVCVIIIGLLIGVNYPYNVPSRTNLTVEFLQQDNLTDSFTANTINVSLAQVSDSQSPLFSNFDFIASNQTLNSTLPINNMNLLELSSPYSNGIQINVYQNSTSSVKLSHFSCQSFISESPYYSVFPVADLYASFATGYASFTTRAYFFTAHGSFLENSSAFSLPGSNKIGISSSNTENNYYLSIPANNMHANFQLNLPSTEGGLMDITTNATNSSPVLFFANNVEESINNGHYVVINGFSSASIEMYGYGAYNIPQDSIKSVSLSSIYPPYTEFEINSSKITAYSSTGDSKILYNNAIINSSGNIVLTTSLANTNLEYLGNSIISPLFFEIIANQALINSNNSSAFNFTHYYVSPYPARVALTVILSTLFGIPISKILRREKEK